jgi:tetratricopeptide (TPR) repeat protein
MSTPPFDLAQAHRWFAVEFNNRAWDLLDKNGRSADETQELLNAAHAAAIHWKAIGTALNEQRAENLLATAYLRAGRAEPALRHAQRCLALSEQNAAAGTETLFDRATALGCAAEAHQLAGDRLEAERLFSLATAAAGKLDPDDRTVFDGLYRTGPAA